MGATVVLGALPAALTSVAPMLGGFPAMPAALALFISGAAVIVLTLYAGLALTGRAATTSQRAGQP